MEIKAHARDGALHAASRAERTLEVADHPDTFFSRDVVTPVDDGCFQVIDGLRLSPEHSIFKVAPRIQVQG